VDGGEGIRLSRREREVAALVAEGMTDRQIGQRLFISERTAEGHVLQIRNKLGLDNRAQVATWFTRRAVLSETAAAPAAAPPAASEPEARPPAALGLPGELTSFIGRDRELGEIRRLLQRTRLLTLSGPGGGGKTRLAVQAAGEVLHRYPDGAWFVDLSPVTGPVGVPQALAAALGAHEREGTDPLDAVSRQLRGPAGRLRCLLILDNCEHVIESCSSVAARLLAACPHLTILCTSRQPLHVPGEGVLKLGPLSLPAPGEEGSAAAAERSDAVRLFVDRASLADPDFELDDRAAAVVADICRALDGIPLALELAAAQAGLMPIDTLLAQLESSVRRAHRRGVPGRQQTMRAAMDWSFDLLGEEERTLLRSLAVCRGSFGAEAAAAIAGGDLAARLEDLQDKSLLVRLPGRPDRFRLLEPIRHHALERLDESGDREAVERRHLEHFAALAERGGRELNGPEQVAWLERLSEEHDNLRAALAFGRDHAPESSLRLALSLERFWSLRGHLSEGRTWFERALERPGPATAERATALNAAAGLAWLQGDLAYARDRLEASLAIRRELGDERGIQGSLANLGVVASTQGDWPAGAAYLEESLELAQRVADDRATGLVLLNVGVLAAHTGDHDRAHRRLTEAAEVLGRAGDPARLANALANQGMLALFRGQVAVAAGHYAESLRIQRTLREPQGLAECLEGVAWIAASRGRPERAVHLGGAGAALRRQHGVPHRPWSRRVVDEWLEGARARLGAAAEAAWAEGGEAGPAEVIALALQECGQD
jgi:predicted ATPase/DNA-binding CsgD family transcriptional regulator